MADLLAERQDYPGADAAYRKAAAIEPTPELNARIASLAERVRESRFPAEFKAIPGAAQITRGDLAALIGVRLERLLAAAPPQQVVITDTAGHWAGRWITQVVRAGVMDPFENHTFQPRLVIRRGDLATAVRRIVTMVAASESCAAQAHHRAADDRGHAADAPGLSGGGRRGGVWRDAAGRGPALRGQSRRDRCRSGGRRSTGYSALCTLTSCAT